MNDENKMPGIENELSKVLNGFSYAFFTVNSDYKIQYANDIALKHIRNIKNSRHLTPGSDFFDYVLDKEAMEAILRNINSGRFIKSNKKILNCTVEYNSDFEIFNPIFDNKNEIKGFSFASICIDNINIYGNEYSPENKLISDVNKEEFESLTDKAENYSVALRLANIGMWVWNSGEDKSYWSDKIFDILGLGKKPENFSISDFAVYVHKDDVENVFDIIKKCVKEGVSVETEFRLLKEKKDYCICKLSAEFVFRKDTKEGKLICLISDITKIKESEMKLEKNTRELEHINLRKDKFFSLVAHDLRSPFTGLLGLAEILASNTGNLSAEDVREISNQIFQSSKQIFTLLENLLEWSRIQRGKINYIKADLPVKPLIDRIIKLYYHNLNQKNLTPINRVNEFSVIRADLYMTELIIRNLLSNAVKFSNFGGLIFFDFKQVPGYNQIIVTDTGVGISEENIRKLMQIDKNYTAKGTLGETGTGLGLILCKEHLDKNGGKIEVKSQLGKGTVIIVSFPAE